MRITDIIEKKRDGQELSEKEIQYFINGVTDNSIPDYQISALLMAIYLNGMNTSETVNLTLSMAHSGDILDLSSLGNKTADKHSTGGVGDKTTLVVAPIAAALGCTVAKMSGRGLGHTGGTVDKLQSITGYNTSLSQDEFITHAEKYGMCLIGHSGNLAPADKKLYAIRDVTGTVESIPLIASSIMSKKLAAGAENIVLDVKYGSGAFMKTPEKAEELARTMVNIGKSAGRNMAALITDMDIPLGHAIGNSLEVEEAIKVLKGEGPEDLKEICVALAARIYSLCYGISIEKSKIAVKNVINDGSAFKILCQSVKAQGGNAELLTGESSFPPAESEIKVFADKDGYIVSMNSELIGKSAGFCGAGRETLEDEIDFSAGVVLNKKYGDRVTKGDLLATVYGNENLLSDAAKILYSAYKFGNEKPNAKPLIYKEII